MPRVAPPIGYSTRRYAAAAIGARPRPNPALERLSALGGQDAGVRVPGRPPADPVDARPRGRAGRPRPGRLLPPEGHGRPAPAGRTGRVPGLGAGTRVRDVVGGVGERPFGRPGARRFGPGGRLGVPGRPGAHLHLMPQGHELVADRRAHLPGAEPYINRAGLPPGLSDTRGYQLACAIERVLDDGIRGGVARPLDDVPSRVRDIADDGQVEDIAHAPLGDLLPRCR